MNNCLCNLFGDNNIWWIIIALIVLLLFGAKRIPELMKGIGKGVRSFKDGMNDIQDKEEEKNE